VSDTTGAVLIVGDWDAFFAEILTPKPPRPGGGETCPACRGEGHRAGWSCTLCEGSGTVTRKERHGGSL
jgi:hypothetical protein